MVNSCVVTVQLSNVALVEFYWEHLYASMKARMIKPLPVLANFASQPLRKF